MPLLNIETKDVHKILFSFNLVEESINTIHSKHFSKNTQKDFDQILAIIRTNKLIQVILSILINNRIPKISFEIFCPLSEFICSDNMSAFQATFNHIVVSYDHKNQLIRSINLGDINLQAIESFKRHKDHNVLNKAIYEYFNWFHNYKYEELILCRENKYYELYSDKDSLSIIDNIEESVFNDAILQKLISDTYHSGRGFMPITGWELTNIEKNRSLSILKQYFKRVFFHGVLLNHKWVSIGLHVISFTESFKANIEYIFTKKKQ